jgi:hypothetical protein
MQATYSPEDNKLRLYVGRVPRDEYEKLRAEGWTSTPKQNCDFVATWTPQRRNTALEYAEIIEDEDMGPEERAADRAERFGEYRDKRTSEATGHADRYDAGPSAHGFQSAARAERAAARHDRIGNHACDAWSKAEYWQRRTAGVIDHALHKSSPAVRMGRIKELEALIRKHESEVEERRTRFHNWQKIAAITEPEKQTALAIKYSGIGLWWSEYKHPRKDKKSSLWSLLTDEQDPITGAEAAAFYLSDHSEPKADDAWSLHYRLRLAYENQMLESQGGRAAFVEMVPGGRIGGKLIMKVNKSNATGRVVSVNLKVPKVGPGWHYKISNVTGTDYALLQMDTERLPTDAYRPPTAEDLAELEMTKEVTKAAAPKKDPCPLVNPTDADAERLQALWNERAKVRYDAQEGRKYMKEHQPSTVCKITQAVYSAASKGSYARAETRQVCRDGELVSQSSNMYSSERAERAKRIGPPVCSVRITSSDSDQWPYVKRVIILTDKPQKPLPKEVWEKYSPEPAAPKFELQST